MKTTETSPPDRPVVFLSYSRKDKRWLDEFRTMLAPLVRNRIVDVWWDGKIKPSQEWRGEIDRALASARIGVLLVSPNFLASNFIAEEELPYLIEAARERRVTLLWILLSPCLYEQTPLREIQAAHDISRPIRGLKGVQRDGVLKEICQKIAEAVEETSSRSAGIEPQLPTAGDVTSSTSNNEEPTQSVRSGSHFQPADVPGLRAPAPVTEGIPFRGLFLVSAFVFFIAIWLHRHTASLLTSLIIAVGFLVAVWKVLLGEDDIRNLGRRFLRKLERSRFGLWLLIVADLGAFLLMSSTFVNPREHYIVCIAPGKGVYHYLPPPPPEFQERSLYDLRVRNDTRTSEIPDLRRRLVYLGPSKKKIKSILDELAVEQRCPGLCSYIQNQLPDTGQDNSHPLLKNEPLYVSMEIGKGDILRSNIVMTSRDKMRRERWDLQDHIADQPVTAIFLEKVPESTP